MDKPINRGTNPVSSSGVAEPAASRPGLPRKITGRAQIGTRPSIEKDLLPTNAAYRFLTGLAYHGAILPLLTAVVSPVFGLKWEGKENLKPLRRQGFVLICNHVHPIDCIFLGILMWGRKVVFTSQEQTFYVPGIGPLIRFLGCVPIATSIRGLRSFLEQMEAAVRKGRIVLVYPEGDISMYCDHLRKFSDGAFTIAAKAQAPVVPVVITPRERKGLWKLLKRMPCLTLTVGKPLYPAQELPPRKAIRDLHSRAVDTMNHLLACGGHAYPEHRDDTKAFWRYGKK